MKQGQRWSVELVDTRGCLRVFEPTLAEVKAAAAQLAAFYNEPFNRAMMTNSSEMDADDVVAHHKALWAEGGRAFLLSLGDTLMGDADFRNFRQSAAEYAIMVGSRATQGLGLGTSFTIMAHALLFRHLGAGKSYSVVIPANQGCLRMLDKVGYEPDDSPFARSFAEEEDDVTRVLERSRFEERNAALLAALVMTTREGRGPDGRRDVLRAAPMGPRVDGRKS